MDFLQCQDADLVSSLTYTGMERIFDGINRINVDATFDFTMDSDGNIIPSTQLANAPTVDNMHYHSDVITADVTYMGHSLGITLTRPTEEQEDRLELFWQMLLEAGMVAGDEGDYQETDISDENAGEPSRAR